MTHDGENLWCSAFKGREGTKIFKLDTNGNVMTSIDAPDEYPLGLAYDGKCFWCSAGRSDHIRNCWVTGSSISFEKEEMKQCVVGLCRAQKYLNIRNLG